MSSSFRINSFEKSKEIEFYFNNKKLTGYEGEPIAASLLAHGIKTLRTCEITGETRGIFCGIGHCYECRADVDGISNIRTCLTPNRQGTKVFSPREKLKDES
ncbi:(2Fe-2S)-binding protein [Bacillus norwichensis]|uniref:(2Fe-2S)-binding protein n=1 Tax=Bacillus norwichensis TaxID=2762217 RepID=A0ABR8VNG8_9BACI|nr:(2Fe-2S)-binding protein [Bacillus norwichensis]MBD8006305.1 (2Fe-2S)-binding protein [Bacillus norwichensis]